MSRFRVIVMAGGYIELLDRNIRAQVLITCMFEAFKEAQIHSQPRTYHDSRFSPLISFSFKSILNQ